MQIERLAGVGKRLSQCRAAGDDVGDIGKIDRVGRFLDPIRDREHVASILVVGRRQVGRSCHDRASDEAQGRISETAIRPCSTPATTTGMSWPGAKSWRVW